MWEESEQLQRFQARTISILFVSIMGLSALGAIWRHNWDLLFYLAVLTGGVLAGICIWSVVMMVLVRAVSLGAALFQSLRKGHQ